MAELAINSFNESIKITRKIQMKIIIYIEIINKLLNNVKQVVG